MKNNKGEKTVNLTQLAANGTQLDLLLAEVRGEARVTRLAPARARKAALFADRVGGGGTRWAPAARAPHDGGGRLRAGAARVG